MTSAIMKRLAVVVWTLAGFNGVADPPQPPVIDPDRPAKSNTALDADQKQLVESNTTFALDLYGRLSEKNGNLFVCPFSISTALSMAYGGARGQTATEMAAVLHFRQKPDRIHRAFGKLLLALKPPEGQQTYRLHIANGFWLPRDYTFLPEFLSLGQSHYQAGIQVLDFANQTEAARQTINQWAAEHTAGKIPEVLAPGVLSSLTRLVLTNATYFKGNWAAKFDAQRTKDAPFTRADGSQVTVPMMRQTGVFGYLETPDLQILELPYVGNDVAMVVLLPRAANGLPKLEQSLNAKQLAEWIGRLRPTEVHVGLPRFTMTDEFNLNQPLGALGMKAAFEAGRADFSGMDGSRYLYIAAVIHKTFVEVNEEGTEAAGVTAIIINTVSLGPPKRIPTFEADRPFLFLIRDVRSGSVLFLGRLSNPKS